MAENPYSKPGFNHIPVGHDIDGYNIRLDLFRLKCIFEASKSMARNDVPVQEPEDMTGFIAQRFQWDEITRLLISISIFGRMIDDKLVLMKRSNVPWVKEILESLETDNLNRWFQSPVGILIPNVNHPEVQRSLTVRGAFNKVLHTKLMNSDTEKDEFQREYFNPILYFYGSKGRTEWKATLDVYTFISTVYKIAISV